jgi:hypothetical protein
MSRVAHLVLLGLIGLGFGVVAVQVTQDWIEGFSVVAAWALAIVAWAALDYLLEPRLHRSLARRSLKLLKDEVTTAFAAWRALRDFEEHCNRALEYVDEKTGVQLLPDWRTVTAGVAISRLG